MMMARKRFHQGKFAPTNPQKYVGDVTNIVFRSSWERMFAGMCDTHKNIIRWSSETEVIPYVKPSTGRIHRYFMDFTIEMLQSDGTKIIKMIEIKPYAETLPPIKNARVSKSYLNACVTYSTNQAKWAAAKLYAKKKGWHFSIITEFELGLKKRPTKQ